jgi:hypothetical protein
MNVPRGLLRLLLGILAAFLPACAAAQFEVSFSLSKTTYLAGEPVFLSLTVKNVSTEPLQISTADPLTFCSGYQFELQGARDRDAMSCMGGGIGSCLGGFPTLAPGKSRTDRILLNIRYDLRRPGSYALNVVYRAKYAPAGKNLPVAAKLSHQDFEKRLEIALAPSNPEDLKPEFEAYARALDSSDLRKRQEPATVIAYLAPAFMEPTILRMLHTPGMQSAGVEGLRNLGSPSAHRALADFVRDSSPTDFPALYQKALRYLGEIGNSSDVPVLLEAAHANALDSYSRELAIESAGEAGGAAAVSSLETELQDRSMDTRLDVVQALPLTGSRAAVPVLIRLLQSPEGRISSFAEYGLETLTHLRGAKMDGIHPPPPTAYSRWIRWWMTDGQTATIFRPDQCGEIKPIPFS